MLLRATATPPLVRCRTGLGNRAVQMTRGPTSSNAFNPVLSSPNRRTGVCLSAGPGCKGCQASSRRPDIAAGSLAEVQLAICHRRTGVGNSGVVAILGEEQGGEGERYARVSVNEDRRQGRGGRSGAEAPIPITHELLIEDTAHVAALEGSRGARSWVCGRGARTRTAVSKQQRANVG